MQNSRRPNSLKYTKGVEINNIDFKMILYTRKLKYEHFKPAF